MISNLKLTDTQNQLIFDQKELDSDVKITSNLEIEEEVYEKDEQQDAKHSDQKVREEITVSDLHNELREINQSIQKNGYLNGNQ